MSTFGSPEAHAANPPETWRVVKAAERCWHVRPAKEDYALSTHKTRREALAAIEHGFVRDLYDKEARWYAGENVHPWRPWADVKAEREANAAKRTVALCLNCGQKLHKVSPWTWVHDDNHALCNYDDLEDNRAARPMLAVAS